MMRVQRQTQPVRKLPVCFRGRSVAPSVVAGPAIHARGSGIDDAAFDEIRPRIEEALARAAADGISDSYQLQQLVRRTVGRWVSDNYRRRPMIIPVLVEV